MLKTSHKITTVLFDMDGTLFDTAPDLGFALNQLLQRYQRPPLPMTTIRPFASDGSRGLLQLGFQITPDHADYLTLREEFLSLYAQHHTKHTTLFVGMADVLHHLANTAMRWGIVTNKPAQYAREIVDYFQLSEQCACLVGGDSVAQPKPAPDSLLLACKLLNVTPQECVYIGDAERDITAAQKADMPAIAALYGYLHDYDNPQLWQANAYIQTPQEIISWLKKNNHISNHKALFNDSA